MKKKEWLDNLARNLKNERAKLKLSQLGLAEKTRLSLATITRIEQKSIENPTLDTIDALGKALKKTDPLDLLKK
ncbi:MAG: helix-turn-helix domain-containing protein [Bdellovibrionaceae bacterium]|nr:helix-turn-helix domain-containing protein [Pseudobdellovibrionaceae bacterium]